MNTSEPRYEKHLLLPKIVLVVALSSNNYQHIWYEISYLQMNMSLFHHITSLCFPHVWRICHIFCRVPCKVFTTKRAILQFLAIWSLVLYLKHVRVSQKNSRVNNDFEKQPFYEDCKVSRLHAHWVSLCVGVQHNFSDFGFLLNHWNMNHVVGTYVTWLCMRTVSIDRFPRFFNNISFCFLASNNTDIRSEYLVYYMFW